MRLRPLILFLVVWSAALSVSAQGQSVVVLGVRSIEGDDELAVALTEALRKTAASVSQWAVGEHSASLSQMMLVHGCDEPDTACLTNVASGLQAKTLVFATMRHSALGAEHDYEVELGLFDAGTGAIAREAKETILRGQTDSAALQSAAERGITSLTTPVAHEPSQSATSMLSVFSAVEGAQVLVDGNPAGAIKLGRLDLPDTTVGQHQVRVEAEGYTPFEAGVEVQDGVACEVHASLSSTTAPTVMAQGDVETDTSSFRIFGRRPIELLPYALIGVGVLSAGGMVASMIVVHGAENNATYVNYNNLVSHNDPLADDACARADEQHTYGGMVSASDAIRVSSLCDRADTFRVLEYVFAGVAAASTIGGVTLLVLSKRDEKPTPQGGVSLGLRPMFGSRMNGLRATVHF